VSPARPKQQPQPRTSWPIGLPLRRLLGIASGLVLVAGFQLFVLTDHTDRWFAWTIAEPLTAATLGALYWGSFVTVRFAMRERTWATARELLLGTTAFTILTLVATLIHLGAFHLTKGPVSAVIAGWAWLIVYVVVPVVLVAMLAQGRRAPAIEIPTRVSMPGWFRVPVVAIGTLIVLTGVALFVAPGWAETWWPWALTGLTSQALGAWWVGVGTTMALTGRENDLPAARGAMVTAFVLGPLLFVALVRYWGHVIWSRPASWIYVAMTLLLPTIGAVGLMVSRFERSQRSEREPVAAPASPR
jgi:hypothetical protein